MPIRALIPLLFISALSAQAEPECAETVQMHEPMLPPTENANHE